MALFKKISLKSFFFILIEIILFYFLIIPNLINIKNINEIPQSLDIVFYLSFIFNILIIGYIILTPVHPKFIMDSKAKKVFKLHYISGALLFVFLSLSIFVPNPIFTYISLLLAFTLHIPTSYLMVKNTFGIRAIMQPLYTFTIFLYTFCFCQLISNPGSIFFLKVSFCIYSTFSWVRVFYFLYEKLLSLKNYIYTLSVFSAGLVSTNYIFKDGTQLYSFLITILCYYLLWRYIFKPVDMNFKAYLTEFTVSIPREQFSSVRMTSALSDKKNSSLEVSRLIYTSLACSKNELSLKKIIKILNGWNIPYSQVRRITTCANKKTITYTEFHLNYKPLWSYLYYNSYNLVKSRQDYFPHKFVLKHIELKKQLEVK